MLAGGSSPLNKKCEGYHLLSSGFVVIRTACYKKRWTSIVESLTRISCFGAYITRNRWLFVIYQSTNRERSLNTRCVYQVVDCAHISVINYKYKM